MLDLSKEETSKTVTHPGLVINNNDPLGAQRLQCRISTLHQGIADSDLPWCRPIRETGSSSGAVSVGVPAIGSIVGIEFTEDDNTNMYWKGAFILNASLPSDFQASFPDCYGMVDANGNILIVDTKNKTANFTLYSGDSIQFTGSAINIIANTVFNIRSQGDINLSAAGSINLKGTTINTNPGSTAADGLTSAARSAPTMPSTNVSNLTEY